MWWCGTAQQDRIYWVDRCRCDKFTIRRYVDMAIWRDAFDHEAWHPSTPLGRGQVGRRLVAALPTPVGAGRLTSEGGVAWRDAQPCLTGPRLTENRCCGAGARGARVRPVGAAPAPHGGACCVASGHIEGTSMQPPSRRRFEPGRVRTRCHPVPSPRRARSDPAPTPRPPGAHPAPTRPGASADPAGPTRLEPAIRPGWHGVRGAVIRPEKRRAGSAVGERDLRCQCSVVEQTRFKRISMPPILWIIS